MSDEIMMMEDVRTFGIAELDKLVRAETAGKLRSFLYELAEGVTTYRTVHSLTEQVQHQYHGRFAIELIQNAYDAISRDIDDKKSLGRIEMSLVMDGGNGTLYVANDGVPFTKSNFKSVSRLGQSDKEPASSIGNKGIGFRSVLEISREPRIWSRRSARSTSFDGYCFGFSPKLVASMLGPILAIHEDRQLLTSEKWFGEIVDWDKLWLDRVRAGVRQQAAAENRTVADWLRDQIEYLSPYLLPWPLYESERDDTVDDFEARGFSTVVALPLLSGAATIVEQKLAEIDAACMLFLDSLKEITIATPNTTRAFRRGTDRVAMGPRCFGAVAIGSTNDSRRYQKWSRQILVAEMPAAVRDSISGLPGHWPKLERVDITIAVGSEIDPAPGKLSIFLPTALETGAALHLNAPFFGDMSRTTISFETETEGAQAGGAYNDFLLHQAAVLAIEAITHDLVGRSLAARRSHLPIL